MAKNYARNVSPAKTPQTEKLPGTNQQKNNAGGFSFVITPMQRLERFLILGADSGTYYVSERKLTVDNTGDIVSLIKSNGRAVVDTIVTISDEGRAPKNAPAIFALALAARYGDAETKKYALANLSKVARTSTDLFSFIQQYHNELGGGFGSVVTKAIRNWYQSMNIGKAAYQFVKYRQRDGWTHHDVLHLAHPKPRDEAESNLFRFAKSLATKASSTESTDKVMANGKVKTPKQPVVINQTLLPDVAVGYLKAKDAKTASEVVKYITDYKLPREAIPTEFLNDLLVWDALLQDMPATALIRNLGKMSQIGLIKPLSSAEKLVVSKLKDAEWLKKSRIHPIAVLAAMKVYQAGRGVKGSLVWTPSRAVVDALDGAFYGTFKNVEPTGKNQLIGLDVSGSMSGGGVCGMDFITPREITSAMALVTMAVEPNTHVFGFSNRFIELDISPRMRLDDVMRKTERLPFERTDCSLPMQYAQKNKLDVDAFSVYTDNETYAGHIHPSEALKQYRNQSGRAAKLVVAATSATNFTIADPNDAGMLDVAGFDTAAPQVIANFFRN